MTAVGRRFNDVVTGFWSFAAPLYDLPALQRWVYQPAQDEVLEALRNHGRTHTIRRVADIACGTGILASRIRRELPVSEVYGIDMSDGMLSQARTRSDQVAWCKAPAERLPFDDGALDAVVSTSAFHFFDQPAAIAEFHRVLDRGGLVVVATISPPQPPVIGKLSSRSANPAHNPSPREMRELFTAAGLAVADQHRVSRPLWTRGVWDLLTAGTRP